MDDETRLPLLLLCLSQPELIPEPACRVTKSAQCCKHAQFNSSRSQSIDNVNGQVSSCGEKSSRNLCRFAGADTREMALR